jgi:hypothetical protein
MAAPQNVTKTQEWFTSMGSDQALGSREQKEGGGSPTDSGDRRVRTFEGENGLPGLVKIPEDAHRLRTEYREPMANKMLVDEMCTEEIRQVSSPFRPS